MADYKIVDAEKLDSDLKSVADSIRAKNNTVSNMSFPDGFKTAVSDLKHKDENDPWLADIRYLRAVDYLFYWDRFIDFVGYIDFSKYTSFNYTFSSCSFEQAPVIDTGNGRNFSYMYAYCHNLTSIEVDISKANNTTRMFDECSKLIEVTLSNTDSNLTSDTFRNCVALTTVNIPVGWRVSIYLQTSNNITTECLHTMIENFADMSDAEISPKFYIGSTNLAKIDEEHIAMLDSKNWSYV